MVLTALYLTKHVNHLYGVTYPSPELSKFWAQHLALRRLTSQSLWHAAFTNCKMYGLILFLQQHTWANAKIQNMLGISCVISSCGYSEGLGNGTLQVEGCE